MSEILLSVIIPAYNEAKNIKSTLQEVSGYFSERNFSYEIIIIDDGSKDETYAIAESCSTLFRSFKVFKNSPNKGKGFTIKRGILEARGEYALFMDADNSTSIYEFDKFLPLLEKGNEVVIASRRLKASEVLGSQPALRIIMGNFYIFLSRLILGVHISDFNCGFKAYSTTAAGKIFNLQRINGWSFDTEILFLAKKHNFAIREIPVKWVHKHTSKVKPVRDGVASFVSLVKIKINDIKGVYEQDK